MIVVNVAMASVRVAKRKWNRTVSLAHIAQSLAVPRTVSGEGIASA